MAVRCDPSLKLATNTLPPCCLTGIVTSPIETGLQKNSNEHHRHWLKDEHRRDCDRWQPGRPVQWPCGQFGRPPGYLPEMQERHRSHCRRWPPNGHLACRPCGCPPGSNSLLAEGSVFIGSEGSD